MLAVAPSGHAPTTDPAEEHDRHERPVPGLRASPRSASCSSRTSACPNPVQLERYVEGAPLVDGTVVWAARPARRVARRPAGHARHRRPTDGDADGDRRATYKGLVFDATGLTSSADLGALRDFFTPLLRSLDTCPRVVVLGTPPEQVTGGERVAQRALEGFTRSLGKEVGRGGTVQLVYVAEGAEAAVDLDAGLPALPEVGLRLRPGRPHRRHRRRSRPAEVTDWQRPLAGKVALVTGASRGIGEQIARVLHRDGATVVGVDVPQAASELQALMKELDGDQLALDITAKDAPQRIAHHLKEKHGGVDVVVHNAGITRDKSSPT